MRYLGIRKFAGFLVTLVLPVAVLAVTAPVCKCGPPTPESYKWDFAKEASGLLEHMHADAYNAQFAADKLNSFNFERDNMDWHADADQLSTERYYDNDMDRILCRLRTIQRVLPPNQQAEITALTPPVLEITDTTQDAIEYVRHNEDRLMLPQYTGLADAMYNEASRIEQATTNHGQYPSMDSAHNHAAASQDVRTGS